MYVLCFRLYLSLLPPVESLIDKGLQVVEAVCCQFEGILVVFIDEDEDVGSLLVVDDRVIVGESVYIPEDHLILRVVLPCECHKFGKDLFAGGTLSARSVEKDHLHPFGPSQKLSHTPTHQFAASWVSL